eukprot:Nitzschia sp. Nitz4//scaffold106_size73319//65112//65894//NITZ4_005747-RA/size73319-processed-gene-0.98-mRNA-1//1//CDS//3329532553//7980//frame0
MESSATPEDRPHGSILKSKSCTEFSALVSHSPHEFQMLTKQHRRISFDNQVKVRPVPTLEEYSIEEKTKYWYQDEDYSEIKAEIKKQARRMVKTRSLSCPSVLEGEDCFRGLEAKLPETATERRISREDAADAVIGEQLRQEYLMDYSDRSADLIRQEYQKVTIHTRTRALQIAQKDACEAQRIWREDSLQSGDQEITHQSAGSKETALTTPTIGEAIISSNRVRADSAPKLRRTKPSHAGEPKIVDGHRPMVSLGLWRQ